jgi:hypothetical protein
MRRVTYYLERDDTKLATAYHQMAHRFQRARNMEELDVSAGWLREDEE